MNRSANVLLATSKTILSGTVFCGIAPYKHEGDMKSDPLELRPEPDNRHHEQAIAVVRTRSNDNERVGYIPWDMAERFKVLLEMLQQKGVGTTVTPWNCSEGRAHFGDFEGMYIIVEMTICIQWRADLNQLDTNEDIMKAHSFLERKLQSIRVRTK